MYVVHEFPTDKMNSQHNDLTGTLSPRSTTAVCFVASSVICSFPLFLLDLWVNVPLRSKPSYFFFAARNFAQRARVAAAILFLPAAEILRVDFTGAGALAFAAAGFDPFRAKAHRFFCARLIRLRADADRVRPGLV